LPGCLVNANWQESSLEAGDSLIFPNEM
jgi:hypothetical protein